MIGRGPLNIRNTVDELKIIFQQIMRHTWYAAVFTILVFVIGCKDNSSKEKKTEKPEMALVEENEAAVPESWIKDRVATAEQRLGKSEAGQVIWNAMEAHGGLAQWYGNGALAFRFNYQPLDDKPQRDSYQIIDTWSNRARHTSISDSTAQYGWTGDTAWVKAKDSTTFAYDTRFWALTPYYFLAQPFVLDGEGVNLELLSQKTYHDEVQDVVKVTFDAGTGEAPDDYYILYFGEEDHRLNAIRYIVSYPGYFDKGEHLPEKFMEIVGKKEVEGIFVPTGYKTYWLTDDETPGEHITEIEVSDVHFVDKLREGYFDVPEGAEIIKNQ